MNPQNFKFDPRTIAAINRQFDARPKKDQIVIRSKLTRQEIERLYREKKLEAIQQTRVLDFGKRVNVFDQEEVRFRAVPYNGKIVIDFGRPIQWTTFSADQAIQLGNYLIETANKL